MKHAVSCIAAAVLCGCGGGGSSSPASPPPVNVAPVAADQSLGTNPDTVLNGTLGANDANGDALTFAIVDDPTSGIVTLSGTGNRSFEYTPNAAFVGSDSFTFTASDAATTSNTATVSVEVNNRPVATGGSYSTSDIVAIDGVVTATDVEGDGFTFSVSAQPTKGAVTAFDGNAGTFTYTPNGTDDGIDTFSVVASDPYQASAPADVDIEIFRWSGTQQFGTAAEEMPTTGGMLVGADGSLTFGGYTEGLLAGAANAGDADGWLRKVDRRGNEVWTRQLGDADTNRFRTLLGNPLGDGFYAIETSTPSAVVYRFDDDGNEQWSTPIDYGALNVASPAYWSNVDSTGNIYVLSWVLTPLNNTVGSTVSKLSGTDGSLIWRRELYPSAEDPATAFIAESQLIFARGIDFDSSDRLIITGGFEDNVLAPMRACGRCPFIASMDADGNDLWLREPDTFVNTCPAHAAGQFYRVTVAQDDSLYIVGNGGRPVFDGTRDGVTARFNADGTQQLWAYCDDTGTDNGLHFVPAIFSSDGGVLTFATVEDPLDPVLNERVSSELVLLKHDTDGNLLWRRTMTVNKADGSPALFLAGSIAEDTQGVIYINAGTDGEATNAASAGDLDIVLMRLGPDGLPR